MRKLLVNAFIREVILYDDEIVITYNFTDSPEHLKLTKEHVIKTEKEIETADKTAISSNIGSYKLCHTAPQNGASQDFRSDLRCFCICNIKKHVILSVSEISYDQSEKAHILLKLTLPGVCRAYGSQRPFYFCNIKKLANIIQVFTQVY